MKKIIIFLTIVLPGFGISAQTNGVNADLQKIVETERAFAQYAADKGTRAAFLEFAAPDGIMFNPNATNAREMWQKRAEAASLLAWQPDFADVSANGVLGYTAGPWEFRPKGKDDKPTDFGHFVTLWQKQPDGSFRFVLDIGVSHAPTQVAGIEWKTPSADDKDNEKKTNVEIFSSSSSCKVASRAFFEIAAEEGLSKAYQRFAADDARLYRENKMPIVGKNNVLSEYKKDKSSIAFAKRNIFFGAADLAYTYSEYTMTKPDKTVEKGNIIQIWKLRGGKWQIVLDLFNPTPEEKK